MTPEARSLELFFIDGRPDGMLTASMFNWTGHVLMAPRTRLAEALKRPEMGCTGVYVLLGEKDDAPLAYIGESEEIGARIRNHDATRDWWTSAVFVTTAGDTLNKAHVKYLEARLVETAREAGATPLENGNTPPRASLTEAAQADMEAFLSYLLMVLPAIRVDMFLKKTRVLTATPITANADPVASSPEPVFELSNRKTGLTATAVLRDGEFIVQAGSQARLEWASVDSHSYRFLHDELRRAGVITPSGEHCVFAQSYAFASPSAAAAVVNGRPSNGTTDWRLQGRGVTYKDWEAEQLARVHTEAAQ